MEQFTELCSWCAVYWCIKSAPR